MWADLTDPGMERAKEAAPIIAAAASVRQPAGRMSRWQNAEMEGTHWFSERDEIMQFGYRGSNENLCKIPSGSF